MGDDDEPQNAGNYAEIVREGLLLFKRGDDDGCDRVSSRITVGILVLVSGFILLDTLTKEPIACFAPVEYTDQWIEYTDSVCWVQNTFTDFFNGDHGGLAEEAREVPYYQWVPIILLVQAIFFALPGMFWSWAAEASGYDLQLYSNKYRDDEGLETPDDERQFLVDRIFVSTTPKLPEGRRRYGKGVLAKDLYFGRFLTIAYVFTKLLYAINAVLQFGFLNSLLGDRFALYGYQALNDWLHGAVDGVGAALFPKVTICQFDIRGPITGSIQKTAVECLLPRNLFYERAFIFLWWWFAFVTVITVLGLLRWLMKNATAGSRRRFVWKYLRSLRHVGEEDKTEVQKFADIGLRSDGIFCLSVILRNSNDLTTAHVVAGVWDRWSQRQEDEREQNP